DIGGDRRVAPTEALAGPSRSGATPATQVWVRGRWLRWVEVVARGDAADHIGRECPRLSGLRQIAHVVLPAGRRVEVQESDQAVARVAERVYHAGGNAHERSLLEPVGLLAETHGQHALEHVEHVDEPLVAVRRRS